MLPYCSAHDKWLIMKLCMYVGYHDANNVSNFGGDPIKFKKHLKNLICYFVFQNMRSAGDHEIMIGRTYFGGDQVTQLNLVLYNGHTSLSTALVLLTSRFQTALSSTSLPISPMSSLMLSLHFFFLLPFLLPSTSATLYPHIPISFSLLPVHTTHLLPFLGYFSHFRCHPILSFLILSNFLTPDINLNTVIPTTPNFFACTFLAAHVSASYVTIMYISPDLPVDSFLICRNKHTQIVDAE